MTTASVYDSYWVERDVERTRARSVARARLAAALLGPPRGTSARLLEVGCGPGWALETLAAAGWDARGTDFSSLAVSRARERGLSAEVHDLERDELPPGQDAVVALEVLEHLVDPLAALRRLVAALAPGGRLVVSLPNEIHLLQRLAILGGRMGFGGHDDPHVRHFDGRHAARLFAAAGLRVVARRHDSIVPPRRRALRTLVEPLARVAPGLLTISHVHLLEPAR